METTLSVLHVVTAVFLVGPMAILPMVGMRALRAGSGAQAAALGKSTFVCSLGSLLVVVFGFGVLGMSDPKFDLSVTTPWIMWSLVAYLVALVLTIAVVVPALRDTNENGGETGAYKRVAMSSGLASLLLLVTVVLMVWKP